MCPKSLPSRRRVFTLGLGTLALAISAVLSPSSAQIVLQNQNSTAVIDPTSQAGMSHWDIQGFNQLNQQWFWYGVGNGPVRSIDTLLFGGPTIIGANEAILHYADPLGAFTLSVDYTLTGGSIVAPGQTANADIQEAIRIQSTTGAPLPIHFYQYSYFNLMERSSDVVQLGQNLHGLYNEADQSSGNAALTETVVTPGAQEGEVAPLGATLAKLNSGGPVTLGPPFFSGPVGPGAVTWALEWDFLINPGNTAIISKDKYLQVVVPEPSALALVILGFTGFALRDRRKKA